MAPHAPPLAGLTRSEVEERTRSGKINQVPDAPSRTIAQIVRANVFTPVNAIITVMFVLIMIAAPGPDALFAGVVISNSVIGIVQELRAKRELDRLAVLNAPRARVIRDSESCEIDVGEVVADEVLELQPGDQIVVDGKVLVSQGLEINESLLTGESDPVVKGSDDEVMSGSFVAAGSGYYQATRIGAESYAATLAEEARRFELAHSELRGGINQILRWLSLIIPPASILLLLSLLAAEDSWREALRGTVAGAVAMVPDGLVLLTSIAFIVGILTLARHKALAKELASVELLARVDILCLDKTGTITTGEISFAGVVPLGCGDDPPPADSMIQDALGAVAASDPNPNATMAAIAADRPAPSDWTQEAAVPFSSARKWSAAQFSDGTWFLGAPEVLLAHVDSAMEARADQCRREIKTHADAGRRLVLLARSDTKLPSQAGDDTELPGGLEPVALVLLEDELRPDAPEILSYFGDQGLTIKVISGDHPATVASIADRAGITVQGEPYDARELPTDQAEMSRVLDANTVFGRVTPHQKRDMVHALQSGGHMVAMTGDGVNDVLAMKDADMGIAMGAGSTATRAVAQLVLLDNAFATLPTVLAEGRRVINNIERVANLFVAKAAYAVILAALTGIFSVPYLFLPRHLTLVGSFSIGIPGFFLALEPNVRRAEAGFVSRVIRFAVPSGVVAGAASFILFQLVRTSGHASLEQARTTAVCVLLVLSLYIVGMLCRPLNSYRIALLVAMAGGYGVALAWSLPRDFFALVVPTGGQWLAIAVVSVVAAAAIEIGPRLLPWWTTPLEAHPFERDDLPD